MLLLDALEHGWCACAEVTSGPHSDRNSPLLASWSSSHALLQVSMTTPTAISQSRLKSFKALAGWTDSSSDSVPMMFLMAESFRLVMQVCVCSPAANCQRQAAVVLQSDSATACCLGPADCCMVSSACCAACALCQSPPPCSTLSVMTTSAVDLLSLLL